MPTGFTAELHDGEQSFEDFVKRCARGMGALISMRDLPLDAPFPETIGPGSAYHEKHLVQARAELAEAEGWTSEQAQIQADAAHGQALARWRERQAEESALRERYTEMLTKVRAWRVPPILDSFREFMIDQLTQSIDHDTGYNDAEPEWLSGEQYRTEAIRKARWSIDYHAEQLTKEHERAKERNDWLFALRSSFVSGVTSEGDAP